MALQGGQLQFRSSYTNNCQELGECFTRITLDVLLPRIFSLGKRCCRGNRKDSGLTRSGCVIFCTTEPLGTRRWIGLCVWSIRNFQQNNFLLCVRVFSSAEKNSCGTLQGFDWAVYFTELTLMLKTLTEKGLAFFVTHARSCFPVGLFWVIKIALLA